MITIDLRLVPILWGIALLVTFTLALFIVYDIGYQNGIDKGIEIVYDSRNLRR